MTKSVNQLINFFRPIGYFLSVDARPGRRDFGGKVRIAGNQIDGQKIHLHAKGLNFADVKVNNSPAKIVKLDNDEIELRPEKNQKLRPAQSAELSKLWGEKCDTLIEISYSKRIGDNSMSGLYPCYYEIDGEKKELLATQFESHYAREAFPCVDEPAAKAKFILQITTAPEFQILSNMPEAAERLCRTELSPLASEQDEKIQLPDDDEGDEEKFEREFGWTDAGEEAFDKQQRLKSLDQKTATFQMTPKMSTYLLAWVIGDLQKVSARTKRGVEVNVYATPAQSPKSLDFALDVATKAIDFYEEYFGVDYPLPKSDHLALPDFSSGAMENWGLVTYRETCLLADENTALATKQSIATVITHELAHQWFGNLVTMKWWDDLWLNESFASLMEHIAPDSLWPEWKIWQMFETHEVISALRRDALDKVQPVRFGVKHPDEISMLFDPAIVYAKGERLLKMLRAFIGEETFRAGLKEYFQKFAYQNTEADDLWNCLSEASGQDVAKLMTPWLTRPGYPVVKASLTDDGQIKLEQERFFSGDNLPSDSLKFTPELTELIKKGKKRNTIRLEAKNLKVGDTVELMTRFDGEKTASFGTAKISKVQSMKLGDIPLKLEGHESYKSRDDQLEHFRKYYNGKEIDLSTKFVIYDFTDFHLTEIWPIPLFIYN